MKSLASRESGHALGVLLALATGLAGCALSVPPPNYDAYIWPPPPDKPRIQLEDIIYGRADVQTGKGGLRRALLGEESQASIDWLQRPYGVAFDSQGRLLVTDQVLRVVFRLDRAGRRGDVFGLGGSLRMQLPLGLGIGPDDRAYVADGMGRKVFCFAPDGAIAQVYGAEGELENPTDAEVSRDGTRLFVADSKGHRIVVFDIASGRRLTAFGSFGEGPGEFNFPLSITHDPEGSLLIVDQFNARVQVFNEEGAYLEDFGQRGTGFGNFVRPKDIAVDEGGFLYVTDAAFDNVQIFDFDWTLLTFVGSGGTAPGQFSGIAGVAAHGDRFAIADIWNHRVQIFRYIVPRDAS